MEIQSLPTGIVTFLFTDIQESTLLWESHPDLMAVALQIHNSMLRQVIQVNGGVVFKVVGDEFQVAFPAAGQALNAAVEVQRGLASAPWNELGPLKVRMGLHAGEAELDPEGDEYVVSHTKNRVARIMSAGHGGQILISNTVVELLGGQLPKNVSLRDMGEHHLKGLLQSEHLYQVIAPDLPAEFPSLKTEGPRSNLPIPATPFLDRESELGIITRLIDDPECRLITLTGIGGSGKTRLAIEAARNSQLNFPNVYFAGLAAINSLEDLVLNLAEVIQHSFYTPPGINLSVEEAKAQLIRYLADKKALLLLDNFEQLVSCAGFLAELLTAAAGIKLMVTSRERLNLPGEWVQEISGLPFPSQQAYAAIPDFAAVQLFVKSAERIGYFSATEEDWSAIARICRLLEGMPLGIEMAAAWVKLISPREIVVEIERNLDFLSATWRNVPERHQTLKAVFETSWRLFSQEEREASCRLAVFLGGFQHEAASQVADVSLSVLASLLDKSVIRRIGSGRFEIHPVLKQYAVEKLESNIVALAEARTRHAHYFSALLRGQMFEKLKGEGQLEALATLRQETQNLRLAFHELVSQHDFQRLDGVLPAMILFYEMNNQRVETHEAIKLLLELEHALRQALATTSDSERSGLPHAFAQTLLALTLAALHNFNVFFGQTQLLSTQEESLQLVQELPDTESKAYTLLLDCRGDSSLSIDHRLEILQQCFAIFKQIGDSWGAALVQLIWADVLNLNNIDEALALPAYQASLQIFEEAGNLWGQALCINGIASIEWKAGHLEEAYRLGCKALEQFSVLGNSERIAEAHRFLGDIAIARQNTRDARRHFEANLAYFTQLGDKTGQQYYQERLVRLDA